MQPLFSDQYNNIISLLEAGHSAHQISSATGVHTSTISRLHSKHHPYLLKSSGGHPTKLSSFKICHGLCLKRLKMLSRLLKLFKTLPMSLFLLRLLVDTWKRLGWRLWWRGKGHCFLNVIGKQGLTLQLAIHIGLWRIVRRWSDGRKWV